MKLLNNRKFAWMVLVICVLGSVIGLGGASLASQRNEVLYVFNEGVDTSYAVTFSMDAYLNNCADYAMLMAEEFRLYVDSDDENAAYVLELALDLTTEEDISARYQTYRSLCAAVETLYTDFYASGKVSDEDAKTFKDAYNNFQGEASKIGYDDYHSLAESFNLERSKFPAKLIANLLGIDALETFS